MHNDQIKIEGSFCLTKETIEDREFHNRLRRDIWLGIVIGNSKDDRMLRPPKTEALVVDQLKDHAERIGLVKFPYPLPPAMAARRTIRLG